MIGVGAGLYSGPAFAASAGTTSEPWTALGQRAESATARANLAGVQRTNQVATQAQVLTGVEAVLGILPSQATVPAEVAAAATAGLFAGWLGSASAFDPNAPMSRIDLAILATDAMGLTGTASEDIGDTSTYAYLTDLSDTGYDLGFANAMLKYGVVPPVSPTRYDAAGPVTTEMLDVALYRMWWNVDVPVTVTLAPANVNIAPGTEDALSAAATNRLGDAIPAANLAQYLPSYTLVGADAAAGSVRGDIFTSDAGGTYTVSVTLSGPLLPAAHAVTATADIHVTRPTPPPPPTGVTAADALGGISLAWTGTTGVTGYTVLEAPAGSSDFVAVGSADGGAPGTATSTTITGLTAGQSYRFEVEAQAAGGSTASAPSASVQFGVAAPTGVTASQAAGGIAVSWTDVSGALSYEVLDAISGSTSYSVVSSLDGGGSLGASVSSATVSGLTTGDSYTFEVEAADAVGNTSTSGASALTVFPVTVTAIGGETNATGTITLYTVTAGETVSVNGVVFDSHSSTDTSGFTNASSLVSLINESTSSALEYQVYASTSGTNEVDLTWTSPGPAGNTIPLATNASGASITLSGPTLSGGAVTLTFEFSAPMNTSTDLLNDLTVTDGHTFGTGATGAWPDNTDYTVALGSNATLQQGDPIEVSTADAAGLPVSATVTCPSLAPAF